ncbi:MAG: hypothetical protein WA738_12410 [Candidatus Angelobacter sp.]
MRTRSLRMLSLLFVACWICRVAGAQAAKPATTPPSTAAPSPKVATPEQIANRQIVQRGRDSYYSLRGQGLDEFQATVKPNWELVLKDELKTSPEQGQNALKLLNGLHFTMFLDKQGQVTVKHSSDAEPPNEQVRQGFDQIYSGIDQAVSGFFATWSLFMLTSPFPAADSEYQLDDLGNQYRLSYKEGPSDIVTLLGKDLVVSEIKVTSPLFVSTVKPQLAKTAKGFVLTGYVGDYKPTSGPGVVHLDVKLENGAVSGLQLPVLLIADSVYDDVPTHMELAFSQHQVKSH